MLMNETSVESTSRQLPKLKFSYSSCSNLACRRVFLKFFAIVVLVQI